MLGRVLRIGYWPLNRLTSETARSGTARAEVTTNGYDQAATGFYNTGKLTSTSRTAGGGSTGSFAYNYDIGGRLANQQWTVDGVLQQSSAAYDAGGRLQYQTFP